MGEWTRCWASSTPRASVKVSLNGGRFVISSEHFSASAGLIDKFAPEVNVSELIGQVANDICADVNGDLGGGDVFKACQLYVLADVSSMLLSERLRRLTSTPTQKPKEA